MHFVTDNGISIRRLHRDHGPITYEIFVPTDVLKVKDASSSFWIHEEDLIGMLRAFGRIK